MAAKSKEETNSDNIKKAMDNLKQMFGAGVVRTASQSLRSKDVLSTGNKSLDEAIGVGGIPLGIIVELFGPEASGKGVMSMGISAQAQKQGLNCMWVDAEHQCNPSWMVTNGIDLEKMDMMDAFLSAEDTLEAIEKLILAGAYQLVVVDSLAALVPEIEMEKKIGESQVGRMGAIMSGGCRKLAQACAKSNCTLIFINQTREKIGVMFGCFHYDARILLSDGTSEKIGKIVNNKIDAEVVSYNSQTGKFENKRITNWFNNGSTEEFLQLVVDKPFGNGRASLPVTKDHFISTRNVNGEFVMDKVKNLHIGDEVGMRIEDIEFLNSCEDDLFQFIVGSLLGNGSLRQISNENSSLRFCHGEKQEDYCRWKYEKLESISNIFSKKKNGKTYFDTSPFYSFSRLRDMFYSLGKKEATLEVANYLNPKSVAIWYLDNGTGDFNKRYRMSICAKSQSLKFLKKCEEFFNNYDIECKLDEKYKRLVFPSKIACYNFTNFISKFVPECMLYKIPKECWESVCDSWDIKTNIIEKLVYSKIVDKYEKPKTKGMNRFDIEVDGNHNYVVDGVVVHNSPETTPGGKALGFYSSLRMRISKTSEKINKDGDQIGVWSKVKIVKNRFGIPQKEAQVPIYFMEYDPSPIEKFMDFAKNSGVIRRHKDNFKFGSCVAENVLDLAPILVEQDLMTSLAEKISTACSKKKIDMSLQDEDIIKIMASIEAGTFKMEDYA